MPNTPKLPESIKNYLIIPFMESCNCSQHSIDGVVEIFEKAIAQELSNLKAQVRKEIEEQITKMENSNWLHGMGLSGSQAEYIEANIKASYRSIPSLKGEEV